MQSIFERGVKYSEEIWVIYRMVQKEDWLSNVFRKDGVEITGPYFFYLHLDFDVVSIGLPLNF